MESYRAEIRIFGLLIFDLISTLLLSAGLDAAGMNWTWGPLNFNIVGPGAAFFIMLWMFHRFGFFKIGIKNDPRESLTYPTENLSLNELNEILDELDILSRRVDRRRNILEAAKTALESNSSTADVMAAMNIKPVQRPKKGVGVI